MDIGVLGTGRVGQTLATAFARLGHDVVMGARDPANERALSWAKAEGERAGAGSFADAARHAEVVVNATAGAASLEALAVAGPDLLARKVLLDVANPLDFSTGQLALLTPSTDSLAERIARAFPDTHVVKALNTVNASVMVEPSAVPGEHHVFMAGDDDAAKQVVRGLLTALGWPEGSVLDLGGLVAARGMEMYLPLWLSLMQQQGTPTFNIRVVHG
jgi:8-hydroxy-5-deazaflavin:NADPH oxidoreductase